MRHDFILHDFNHKMPNNLINTKHCGLITYRDDNTVICMQRVFRRLNAQKYVKLQVIMQNFSHNNIIEVNYIKD